MRAWVPFLAFLLVWAPFGGLAIWYYGGRQYERDRGPGFAVINLVGAACAVAVSVSLQGWAWS